MAHRGNENDICNVFKYLAPKVDDKENKKDADATKMVTKNMEKNKKTFYVFYEEESLNQRRERSRGIGSVDQTEWVHVFTKKVLDGTSKDNVKFTGTTAGNVIGPVGMLDYEKVWRATYEQKKVIFGDARVAVGGTGTEGALEDDGDAELAGTSKPARRRVRQLSDVEPVFFHNINPAFLEEMVHILIDKKDQLQGLVDFTASDGPLALYALRNNVKYLGFCHTDKHVDGLYKWLTKVMWDDMKTPGNINYEPRLNALLEEMGKEDEGVDDDDSGAGGAAEPKANTKAKGKRKQRPRRRQELVPTRHWHGQ